jgi:hypothetical protein
MTVVNDHGYKCGKARFSGAPKPPREGARVLPRSLMRVKINYLAAIPCAPRGNPPSVSTMVRVPFGFTLKATTD